MKGDADKERLNQALTFLTARVGEVTHLQNKSLTDELTEKAIAEVGTQKVLLNYFGGLLNICLILIGMLRKATGKEIDEILHEIGEIAEATNRD